MARSPPCPWAPGARACGLGARAAPLGCTPALSLPGEGVGVDAVLPHLEMEPGGRACHSLHQYAILLPGPEHEPQVPGHRDGDVQVAPGHKALPAEPLGVWHDCGHRSVGPWTSDMPQGTFFRCRGAGQAPGEAGVGWGRIFISIQRPVSDSACPASNPESGSYRLPGAHPRVTCHFPGEEETGLWGGSRSQRGHDKGLSGRLAGTTRWPESLGSADGVLGGCDHNPRVPPPND